MSVLRKSFVGSSCFSFKYRAILFASAVSLSFAGVGSSQAREFDSFDDQVALVEPADPVTTTASLPPVNVAPVETVQHFRVHRSPIRKDSVALSVVTLDTDEERTIELPGVEGMSFNTICRTTSGARVACGSRARVQLVNFVTRRDMACRMAAPVGEMPKVIACSIDGIDLGEWIVRSGIGRPTSEGLHVAAAREARSSERGMWADAETRNGLVLAAQR